MGKKLYLLLLLGLSFPLLANPRYEDDFRLMAFNVFMLPRLITHWGQESRADLIASAEFMRGQDLIILNELFDHASAQKLLDGLRPEYRHQTAVLASSQGSWDQTLGTSHPLKATNGGVAIVSRWPIVEKIQYMYAQGCGGDIFSNKGFIYVKVMKNGKPYHVVGTHAQSEAVGCTNAAAVRASQFDEIRRFVEAKNIPKSEVLFIGGDLNVIKDTAEYQDLLQRLAVGEPDSYAGHFSSWDPIGNGMAFGQYPNADQSEYLDYIFYSARHARPSYWHNQSLDVPSPRWAEGNYYYQEYSDHYPVTAFAFADENTPTHSFRPGNRPYETVHLKHEATGLYITANDNRVDDWLTVSASQAEFHTAFSLDNWYPAKHAFCIRSGDFVQVQSNAHPGYYWNWFLGLKGSYGYYLKKNDASDLLRLHILNDREECLQNGDRVYFVDKDTVKGRDSILQYWPDGDWQNHMFLWSSQVGVNEIFTVEMPIQPTFTDWTPGLKRRN